MRYPGDGLAREIAMGVDPGADGGAAEGEFAEVNLGAFQAFECVLDLAGISAEFLAQANRSRLLQPLRRTFLLHRSDAGPAR